MDIMKVRTLILSTGAVYDHIVFIGTDENGFIRFIWKEREVRVNPTNIVSYELPNTPD